jgi:hypothetical protein
VVEWFVVLVVGAEVVLDDVDVVPVVDDGELARVLADELVTEFVAVPLPEEPAPVVAPDVELSELPAVVLETADVLPVEPAAPATQRFPMHASPGSHADPVVHTHR